MITTLDQFYTNKEVAKDCFEILKNYIAYINKKIIFVEPSAGTGSFSNLLPVDRSVALDIDPKNDNILKMDFFNYSMEGDNENLVVVVGNPPFGKCNSLAIRFFNHSATFCDVIAFIVPRTFKRVSVQNRLNLNFHLVSQVDLAENGSFTPNIQAKCCFQIYKKSEVPRKKIKDSLVCSDFSFVKYNSKFPDLNSFDFAIKAYGSNCGKIFTENLSNLRPKSYHFIKSNIGIQEIINKFNSLDYSISKDSVRQCSLGKADLIKLYLS